ncbi:MAG TPA: hypothetical protein ENJ01_11890 [Gammaproteobacteria bacterium]|nr:hypothetical protein [Gammaproteobacteria bacterium]
MRKFILLVVLVLPACTMGLWETSRESVWIDGFYVNRERGELLVSTRDGGYLFPIDDELARMLLLSRRIEMRPEFRGFAIDRENNVSGKLTLVIIDPDLSQEDRAVLKGIELHTYGDGRPAYSRQLEGKRYEIEGELALLKLDKPLEVIVTVPDSYVVAAGKIIATPVTVVIDIATVPVVGFYAVLIMATGN